MKATVPLFAEGARFLVPLRGSAMVSTEFGDVDVDVTGEAVLVMGHPLGENRSVEAERFVMATTPVRGRDADTGVISIIGEEISGAVEFGSRADAVSLHGPCRVHYPRLDDDRGPERDRGCYYLPRTLPAGVHIDFRVLGVTRGRVRSKISIAVACAAGENEAFSSVKFEIDGPWRLLGESAENCHPDLSVNTRTLRIQPVGFRSSATDPSPSGSTANAQLATASTVWDKSCIDFDINPIEIITSATLKTSSDQAAIRASYTHPDPNTIEVFFVQNPLTASGGGNAGAIGVASQKVVVAEPNGGNPVLIAHELGHALGLLHPPSSDNGSVMDPTGSAMNPGTELVSHWMCQNIATPALQTETTTCCLSHDTGDHYLRDFPEDVGLEPADPLPPGRTRYSMSNVWNRLTDSAGPFGANGPDHQHPARFQSDGTTVHTNYLWARVEQRAAMLVRNAEASFFLKHPGSGGGAANLDLLGTVPVTSVPGNVRIPWQVPASAPNHSCVFAVVRSPAEPQDDPVALNWQQFEALSRSDNDWAQRNLNIRQTTGGGNVSHGAPVIVAIPRQQGEAHLRFVVDAQGAKTADELIVTLGEEKHEVPPGEVVEFETGAGYPYLPIIVSGVWRGRGGTVGLDVHSDDEELTGYGWEFRAGDRVDFIDQLVDTLLGALSDLARQRDSDPACRILRTLRRERLGGCTTSGGLIETTRELEHAFAELAGALARNRHANAFGVAETIEQMLASSGNDRLELLFSAAERIQMAVWCAANMS